MSVEKDLEIMEEALYKLNELAEIYTENDITLPLASILYAIIGSVYGGSLLSLCNIIDEFSKAELDRLLEYKENNILH